MSPSRHTRRATFRAALAAPVAILGPRRATAQSNALDATSLQAAFLALADGFDGRAGICARAGDAVAAVNGGAPFPMQSVVKLVVSAATLDAVDRRGGSLDEPVVVRREDLSLFVQPIADLATGDGFATTLGDLVVRAVADSDSAANDILFRRLGGAGPIRAFLAGNGIAGVRVDRQERDLQTDIAGLEWRPEFVDPALLQAAIGSVPPEQADAAFAASLTDGRDTATPDAMADLLRALAAGALLSPTSTAFLLAAMERTATGPDRLRAGTPPGWTVAHKTGTGPTRGGVNQATNDVGILSAPDGGRVALAVFLSGSRRSPEERAALIARAAQATVAAWR